MVMSAELQTLKATSAGARPMGEKLESLCYDPRITCLLMPVPFKHPAGTVAPPPAPTDDAPLSRAAKRRQRQAKAKAAAKVKITHPGGGGGTARRTVPAELKDLHQKMADGPLICWDFNLECGCQEKCVRGVWDTPTKSVVLAPGKEAGKEPTTRLDYQVLWRCRLIPRLGSAAMQTDTIFQVLGALFRRFIRLVKPSYSHVFACVMVQ